ncbi:MAG: penicillin-insensitive murein endopeptidase [Bdellovibrionota bacterium]
MKANILVIFTAFLGATTAMAAHTPEENRELFALWNKIEKPLETSKVNSIGDYGAGCIMGAETLPLDGTNFSVMHPSRLRYFGHPVLVSFIKNLSEEMSAKKLPRLLIGDMGRPRGGPMISGHASHQMGLDVDLWYRMEKHKPSAKEREEWGAPQLVKNNRSVTKGWTKQQRTLVTLAAASPDVERIFVNPAIKKDLCEKFPDAPWQYKFRAWWGHADHLHVRLFCPKDSASCKKQEPLDPKNNQCGAELAWWFSKEAEEAGAEKSKQIAERGFPELPKECEQMVEDLKVARH